MIGYVNLNTPSKQLLSDLIEHATNDHNIDFKFIDTWKEYLTVRHSRHGVKLIIKTFRSNCNRLFRQYCEELAADTATISKLLVYQVLNNAINFYEREFSILSDMIDEYEAYLMSGNLIDTLIFNDSRPIDKLWDHRGI